MIAEYDPGVGSELRDESKNFQGFWATVDEIAHAPQLVRAPLEANVAQKGLELVETTLNIAYGVDGHGQGIRKIIEAECRGEKARCEWMQSSVEYVWNRQAEQWDFRVE